MEEGFFVGPEEVETSLERSMMIRPFDGIVPKIAESAFISEAAYIVGDVTIGAFATVWPGAVIRGDYAGITIGPHSNVEDNCVVHCGTPLVIGREVIVGHGAVIHCARIGDNCLIGSNATLLDGADIGEFCIIGAGSLGPPDAKIPPRSLVMGVPGRIKGRLSDEQVEMLRQGGRSYAEFARKFKEQGL
jgi:carbonic anhydrase/acetyltransferase-like protein (isoleucine patch superfamily)